MKTLLANIFVFLALVGAIVVGIPSLYAINNAFVAYKVGNSEDQNRKKIASLPSMIGHNWVQLHLEEFATLRTKYKDFEIWTREPFDGKTIALNSNGLRRTDNQKQGDEQVAFFGGSTMWGYGVNDQNTIPAHFKNISNKSVFNYGEVGFIARQSLNRLENLFVAGIHPETVVFYDGVNDVLHKCRAENDFSSSAQESVIRHRLSNNSVLLSGIDETLTFRHIIQPVLSIIRKYKNNAALVSGNAKAYDCDTNNEKAKKIAKAWYLDWLSAKSLVESNGGQFVAVLQPVSYISNPNVGYLKEATTLPFDEQLSAQYKVIYREITALLREKNFPYLDLTMSLDGDNSYYFDFCHINPDGNKIVAENINKYLIKNE